MSNKSSGAVVVRYANNTTMVALLWATMNGLLLALQPHLMLWWHPLCNNPEESSYFADGFPLPYQQWSQASSMEFNFMPHVFLLNVIILAGALVALYCMLFGRIVSWMPASRKFFLAIGIAGNLLALLYLVLVWQVTFWPVKSIALTSWGESYFSYRPDFLRPAGSHTCHVY